MNKELNIKLSGVECATVTEDSGGNLSLVYNSDYPENATPISLSMPVGHLKYPKKIVLPFLQGLLPDSENALKAIAHKYGVNEKNPFRILQHIGHEAAGALEFVSGKSSKSIPDIALRNLDDYEIARMLKEKINEYEDGTPGSNQAGQLSLAGAQAKIALHKSPEGLWLESQGETISTHIIKPVPSRWKNLDIVEHQTMLAATKLGLRVAKSEISAFDSLAVFITERYDRKITPNGVFERIHQEDLCQALSVSPSKKYQADGGPGVGKIAELIREIYSMEDRSVLSVEFFKALVFNVLARCTDAHAKNYSVMLAGQRVALAPLYDLSSTVLYNFQPKSAMSINGKYRFDEISTDDLLAEAKRLAVDSNVAEEFVLDIKSNLLDAFSNAGSDIRASIKTDAARKTTAALVDGLKKYS